MKFDFNRIQDMQTENRLTINQFKIGLKYKVDIYLWGYLSEFEKQLLLLILDLRSNRYINILAVHVDVASA